LHTAHPYRGCDLVALALMTASSRIIKAPLSVGVSGDGDTESGAMLCLRGRELAAFVLVDTLQRY
jgi:hypothetical protein